MGFEWRGTFKLTSVNDPSLGVMPFHEPLYLAFSTLIPSASPSSQQTDPSTAHTNREPIRTRPHPISPSQTAKPLASPSPCLRRGPIPFRYLMRSCLPSRGESPGSPCGESKRPHLLHSIKATDGALVGRQSWEQVRRLLHTESMESVADTFTFALQNSRSCRHSLKRRRSRRRRKMMKRGNEPRTKRARVSRRVDTTNRIG